MRTSSTTTKQQQNNNSTWCQVWKYERVLMYTVPGTWYVPVRIKQVILCYLDVPYILVHI